MDAPVAIGPQPRLRAWRRAAYDHQFSAQLQPGSFPQNSGERLPLKWFWTFLATLPSRTVMEFVGHVRTQRRKTIGQEIGRRREKVGDRARIAERHRLEFAESDFDGAIQGRGDDAGLPSARRSAELNRRESQAPPTRLRRR